MAYLTSLGIETIFAFLLGISPSIFWLYFYFKSDPKPEPKRMVTLVFFLGAFSTILAIILELSTIFVVAKTTHVVVNSKNLLSIILFAFFEELAKFLAVYISVRNTIFFDEKTDPFLYLISAALGFALVENILILFSEILSPGTQAVSINTFSVLHLKESLITIANIGVFRFLGATFLHLLSSGTLGFFWSYSILKQKRFLFLIGFSVAVFLHALFNFGIINTAIGVHFVILTFLSGGLIFLHYLYKSLKFKNY